MKNYALLKSSDYLGVTEKTEIKSGANSGAAVAIPEEIAEAQSKENAGKPLFPSVVVGVEGLEPPAKTRAKTSSKNHLTPNAPPPTADEFHLIQMFRQLSLEERERLIEQLRSSSG